LKVTIFAYFKDMKYSLLLTFIALLLFTCTGLAQAPHGDTATAAVRPVRDTAAAAAQAPDASADDGMNVFLLFFGIAFFGIAIAAIFVGAAIMVGFLVILFALVSAGVLSTGILVGMYRRSVAAGFRTLLVIACGVAGLFTGAVGLWLVGSIFDLKWKAQTALLTGTLGGLAGGMALGLILFFIFNSFFRYCRQRLTF
jgi:hypothetical protein